MTNKSFLGELYNFIICNLGKSIDQILFMFFQNLKLSLVYFKDAGKILQVAKFQGDKSEL